MGVALGPAVDIDLHQRDHLIHPVVSGPPLAVSCAFSEHSVFVGRVACYAAMGPSWLAPRYGWAAGYPGTWN